MLLLLKILLKILEEQLLVNIYHHASEMGLRIRKGYSYMYLTMHEETI